MGYSLFDPIRNQDWFYQVYDACERFNCGIEGWHTESGPGVYEAVCVLFSAHKMIVCTTES